MSATNWGVEKDPIAISKRAKGRDRYNTRRHGAAILRRWEAGKLLGEVGYPLRWGWQSKLARLLGVHRSTICRDFAGCETAIQLLSRVEHYEMLGEPLIAELFRWESMRVFEECEELQRLTWRLDRRRRLGLRW